MDKILKKVNTKPPLVSLIIAATLFGLISCSDTKMEPSGEAFSTAADVHSNEQVIATTAEIDALLASNPRGWNEKVFETETELLIRNDEPSEAIATLPTATTEERPRAQALLW